MLWLTCEVPKLEARSSKLEARELQQTIDRGSPNMGGKKVYDARNDRHCDGRRNDQANDKWGVHTLLQRSVSTSIERVCAR
jgi:hypothetical protein